MDSGNGGPAGPAPASGGDDGRAAGVEWLQNRLFGEPPEPPARREPPPAAQPGRRRRAQDEPESAAPSKPSLPSRLPGQAAQSPQPGSPRKARVRTRLTPASDEPVVWEVDRRVVPVVVGELDGYPHLVICVDRATGFILAADVVPPDAPAEVVTKTVAKLARTGLPDAVCVMRPALAEVLQTGLARLGLGEVPVVVARSLPAVTQALRSFGQFVGADFDAPRRYWRDLARAYPDLPGLMADAAAYFDAAPWRCLTDEHPVAARLLGGGHASGRTRTRYLCVMGAAGETFGLVAFTTLAGYRAVARHPGNRLPPVSLLSVTFDDAPELDEEFRARLARRYAIRNPAAFPFFARQEGGGKRRLPAPDELDELRVWLQVLPAFVQRHRGGLVRRTRLRSRAATPLIDRFGVTVGAARFEAELEFPAAD